MVSQNGFVLSSANGAGEATYYSAAHTQGIGKSDESGWIGATEAKESPGTLPDSGTTTTLLGAGILSLALFAPRKFWAALSRSSIEMRLFKVGPEWGVRRPQSVGASTFG